MRGFTALLVLLPLAACSYGNGVAPPDGESLDSLIKALYDVISGPAGKKRDWNRMRALFAPGAQLSAVVTRPTGEKVRVVMTPEDYITRSGPALETNGFFEKEIARRTETFGQIAHAWSTYEARRNANDAKPFMRGINSIQAMHDGKRWWVVSIYWQAEDAKNPLPDKYLRSGH